MQDDRTIREFGALYGVKSLYENHSGFSDDVRRTFPVSGRQVDGSKRKGCAKNRGKAVLRAPPNICLG